MVALLLVQLALCLAILHREIVQGQFRNLASSIFFAVYLVLYVLEPLVLHLFFGGPISIVRGSTERLTDPHVYLLYNCYGIGLLLAYLLLAGRGPGRITPPAPPADREGPSLRTYARGVVVLIIAGFGLFVYGTGMPLAELLAASRFAWFGEGTLSLLWLTVASYFMALTGVYAYLAERTRSRQLWLLVLGLGVIVLQGMITKDRKWVIFLVSGWLAGRYDTSGRRLVMSRTAGGALAALFVVLVFSQFLRDVLVRYFLGEHLDLVQQFGTWWATLIESGDLSYFYRATLEAIHQNVSNGFTIPLALPRRLLFFFLPVGWSGGLKVEDIAASFSDIVDGGTALRRGNMPPGLFGLFVISFGWLASLLLVPLLALLLRKLDQVFRAGRGLFRMAALSLYLFAVVLGFRGDESSAVYYVISTLLFLVFIRLVAFRAGPAAA